MGARKPLTQGPHLGARQHHGQPPRPFRPYELAERFERLLQYLGIEERQGIERLVLRAGRDIAVHGQILEKRPDLGGAEIARVSVAAKGDEAASPVLVRLFGAHEISTPPDLGDERVEHLSVRPPHRAESRIGLLTITAAAWPGKRRVARDGSVVGR